MVGARPDAARFSATVGPAIERAPSPDGGGVPRLYGEMVDLLWKDGNTEGAILLEELWNELVQTYSFSLLCASAMGNFVQADADGFRRICDRHTHVMPTERHAPDGGTDRGDDIALLQQHARALETELEYRKELERRLREALAERHRAEEALLRSEAELKDFLENAIEGIHWVGPDGTILYANDAELKMLGYSREEYVGRHIAAFHADRPVVDDMLQRLARNEPLIRHEARLRCRDRSVQASTLGRRSRICSRRC